MKEINLEFIYELGARIRFLAEFQYTAKNRRDICNAIFGMEKGIPLLFEEYPDLTVCKESGQYFLDYVKRVNKWESKYLNQKGTRVDKADAKTDVMFEALIDRAEKFEIVLLADLRNLNIYQPLEKGGYNTRTLLSNTEHILAKDILLKLSDDVVREIREFGRCLVFDNYTASGFHILRALEIVLHEYYVLRCSPTNPTERLDSWFEYLKRLKNICDNTPPILNDNDRNHTQNICTLLHQIRINHRNLIMHPEVTLDENDILHLTNIVKTAIEAMAEKLEDKQRK